MKKTSIHWLIFVIFIAGTVIPLFWVSVPRLWKADIVSTWVTIISLHAPTGLTANAVSAARINIAWSPVSGASFYKIYRDGLFIGSSTATFFSDTGLSPSTGYSYTVSAANVFGGESEQSSPISATTQQITKIGGAALLPEKEVKEIKMTAAEIRVKMEGILKKLAVLRARLKLILDKEAAKIIPPKYAFVKNLFYGKKNNDVRYLQAFLRSQGTEIYPEGLITGWFGPLTKAAVIRFQEKYAEDILSRWGLSAGTGFVGETTRTKINEILLGR